MDVCSVDWGAMGTWVGAVGTWFAGAAALLAVRLLLYYNERTRPFLILDFDPARNIKPQTNVSRYRSLGKMSEWFRVAGHGAAVAGEARLIAGKMR